MSIIIQWESTVGKQVPGAQSDILKFTAFSNQMSKILKKAANLTLEKPWSENAWLFCLINEINHVID